MSDGESTAGSDQDRFDLCGVEEVKEKTALAFDFLHPQMGRHQIGVFWDGEGIYALDNYCPHEWAMLHHGWVEPGQVICPLHSAVFDLKTGECLDKYTYDTTAYEVELRGDRVWVHAPGETPLEPWTSKTTWVDGKPQGEP